MVRIKNNRIPCVFLAMLILLLGMYFENIKADSMLQYAAVLNTHSHTVSYHASIKDARACTTEMLGIRNNAGIEQLASRSLGQRREIKLSLDFLCYNIISLYEGKFFTSPWLIPFHSQYRNGLVTNYIHKSDGKKRV